MMTQHDRLAEALRAVGLDDLAALAADGYYHSQLVLPELKLINDLSVEAGRRPERLEAILALRTDVMNGDYKHDHRVEQADKRHTDPRAHEGTADQR